MSTLESVIARSLRDPDWYCSAILRSPNHPWQSDFLNAIADLDRARRREPTLINHGLKRRITVRAGHGKGKTHALAKLCYWWNSTRRGRIVTTAPKEAQLRTRLWPELRKLHASAIRHYSEMVTIHQTTVQWDDSYDWCVVAETASQPENLAGFHNEWLLFIVDEASGVPQKFFETIEGAVTEPGNVMVLSGNTTQVVGEFYDSHMKAKVSQLYHPMHVKWTDAPRNMDAWGRDMIRKYGENNAVVKVRLFGEFVDMAENQLIALAWINAAHERKWQEEGSWPRLRVTCDVADGGEDETVITVGQLYDTVTRVRSMARFQFPASESPIEAANAVERIWHEWGGDPKRGDDIVVDAMGAGAGTAGYLIKRGLPVVQYKGGEQADDPVRWRCRRVQSYMVMRDAFRDGSVYLDEGLLPSDEWDDFTGQMTSVKSKPGIERVEDLMTKEDMKRGGVKSPDMADSMCMMFTGLSPVIARPDGALDLFTVAGIGSRYANEVF